MATSVTELLRRVRHLIQDGAGVRWTDEELLLWLNDAARQLVVVKPDANAVTEPFTCVAGTRQTLPAGGVQLLDIPRNLTGTMRIVRRIDRAVLDAENPDWHSATGASLVRFFTYDARAPRAFLVYPPALVTSEVELVYGKVPDPVKMDDNITLEDVYVGPLVDYVCYRAYAKDADFAQSAQRAQLFLTAFHAAVGGKQVVEAEAVQAAGESTDAVR